MVPHADFYWLPDLPVLAARPFRRGARRGGADPLPEGVRLLVDLDAEAEPEADGAAAAIPRLRVPLAEGEAPAPEQMRDLLEVMDAAVAAGGVVRLACGGGDRAATVAACFLVRHGWSADAALAEVAARGVDRPADERSAVGRFPLSEAQATFVRHWPAPDAGERDRVRGALIGLAAGDALGATAEFRPPGTFAPLTDMVGGGVHGVRPGEWTDDTSMALCLAESLLERGWDAADQMHRYVRWWKEGHLASTGRCFDIGTTTRTALAAFVRTGEPYAGSTDPHAAGNGSLMRLAPVAAYFRADPAEALRRCADSSRTTHAARVAVDACRLLGALLLGAFRGDPKAALLEPGYAPIPGYWADAPLAAPVARVAAGSYRTRRPPDIRGSGYVVHSLEAALWAFAHTDDFRAGCLAAANLGDDADTTAAVCGQLAGACYGESAIPAPWRARLALPGTLARLAAGLARRPAAA